MDEARGGEDVGSIVESILDKCNSASLSMANVNRAHRVGQSQRNSSQLGKPRARQIIVQFKDYDSKVEVMRSRKMLRNAMPNVYVNGDLTQVRSALLFKARALKREKRLPTAGLMTAVSLSRTTTAESRPSPAKPTWQPFARWTQHVPASDFVELGRGLPPADVCGGDAAVAV